MIEATLPNHDPRSVQTPIDDFSTSNSRRRHRRRIRPANWEDRVAACDNCGQGPMRRAHRQSVLEFLFSCFGFFPFVCKNCFHRPYRSHRVHTLIAVIAVASISATVTVSAKNVWQEHRRTRWRETARQRVGPVPSAPAVAPVETPHALTNEDVVNLTKAGLSSQFIVQLIHRESHKFRVDPESLASIKQAGTPEEVIFAMVDVTSPPTSGR